MAEDGTVQAIDDVTTKMEDVENGAGVEDQKELFVADEMMEEEKPKMQKEEYVDQNEYVSTSFLLSVDCRAYNFFLICRNLTWLAWTFRRNLSQYPSLTFKLTP